jgi:hypothetical protein
MAQPLYAQHATVTQDGQGNPFLVYTGQSGNVLYEVNSLGNVSVVGGITSAGIGQPQIVYSLNASLGFAVFNTATAVNMLPTTAPTGTYQIQLYLVTTTAFVTNTEEVITFGWSDASGAQTRAFTTTAKAIGTTLVGSQLIQSVTGTAVTYTPSVTGSNATAGVNSVSIVVTRVI